jgi:hypothetical protein
MHYVLTQLNKMDVLMLDTLNLEVTPTSFALIVKNICMVSFFSQRFTVSYVIRDEYFCYSSEEEIKV